MINYTTPIKTVEFRETFYMVQKQTEMREKPPRETTRFIIHNSNCSEDFLIGFFGQHLCGTISNFLISLVPDPCVVKDEAFLGSFYQKRLD